METIIKVTAIILLSIGAIVAAIRLAWFVSTLFKKKNRITRFLDKLNIKEIKEKLKIIWHVIKSDECAVYCSYNDKPEKAECYIRENGDDVFIESIIVFTERYKDGEFGRPMPNDPK